MRSNVSRCDCGVWCHHAGGIFWGHPQQKKFKIFENILQQLTCCRAECAIFIVVNCNELTLLAFGHDPWGFITL